MAEEEKKDEIWLRAPRTKVSTRRRLLSLSLCIHIPYR